MSDYQTDFSSLLLLYDAQKKKIETETLRAKNIDVQSITYKGNDIEKTFEDYLIRYYKITYTYQEFFDMNRRYHGFCFGYLLIDQEQRNITSYALTLRFVNEFVGGDIRLKEIYFPITINNDFNKGRLKVKKNEDYPHRPDVYIINVPTQTPNSLVTYRS